MSSIWPRTALGELLKQRKHFVLVDDLRTYKRCRVQLHAKGVVLRDEVPGAEIKTKNQQVCRAGEFLVAEIDAKLGGYGLVPSDLEGAIVSSHYFLFEVDETKLLKGYLAYFARTQAFAEQVNAQGSTNYAAIRPSHVLQYQIPLPPLDEQRRIVAQIDDLTTQATLAIKLHVDCKEALASLEQSISRSMFSRMPKESRTVPLGEISDIRSGVTLGRTLKGPTITLPYLRVANVQDGHLLLDEVKEVEIRADEEHKWRLERGDLLLTEGGDWDKLGRGTVWNEEISNCIHQNHIFRVRSTREEFVPAFLAAYVASPIGKRYFQEASKQTTNLASINQRQLKAFPIPIIPRDEQLRLVKYLTEIKGRVAALKELQLSVGRELKALVPSILDRAFRGELMQAHSEPFTLASFSEPALPPIKHSQGIVFKRAAIAAFVINELHDDSHLGRTKLEKLNHLLEYHLGVPLEREPVRDAAGPNDYPALRKVESLAAKRGWFVVKGSEERGGIRYEVGANIQDRIGAGEHILGDKLDAAKKLIALLRKADAKQIEIIATLYGAWNDFLLRGHTPSDAELIADVQNNWHEAKKAIPADKWPKAIAWMREKGLIPRGTGRPVPQKKQDTVASKRKRRNGMRGRTIRLGEQK